MKRLIFTTFILVLSAGTALADGQTEFKQNRDSQFFNTVTITAENDTDIVAEHGINLILPEGAAILWNRDQEGLTIGGTAADKVTDVPTFNEGWNIAHFAISEDLVSGETITIDGMKVKTFDDSTANLSLGLDVDGGEITDRNVHFFWVEDFDYTDFIKPYPPYQFTAAYNEDTGDMDLSWKNPPDYDLNQINLWRDYTRGDRSYEEQFVWAGPESSVDATDRNVKLGDTITYYLFVADNGGNESEKETLTITVGEPIPEPEPVPIEEQTTPEDLELSELDGRFNYFNVRYQIKCRPSGVAVAEGNSLCLWSKIHLLYAQAKLDRSDVDTSFSERELRLMGLRLPFAEKRYETNCIAVEEQAKYCSALGKAIDRANFFLNQEE